MANVKKERSRRGGRRIVFLLQLLLVLGFIGALGYSFWGAVLVRREAPERLGSLELLNRVEGAQALAQVSRLHGIEITLKAAYIVDYASKGERVTAWVADAGSAAAAKSLIQRMMKGIEDGNEVFSDLRRLSVNGREVFQVAGPGGEHFFYTSGEKVVWLTVQAADALYYMKLALKTF